MAGYDPKRGRPVVADDDDTSVAPVDALLDPIVVADRTAEVDLRDAGSTAPASVGHAAPSVTPSPVELAPPPDPITGRIAVVAGVAAAAAIVVVLFRRRRR